MGVLIQVSFLAFLGPFAHAVVNAAYGLTAKEFHLTIQTASYQTTVGILLAGISPILWSPISNVYGRRPVLIFVSAFGIAMQCASATVKTWGGVLVVRAFVGVGTSAGMGIGAAVVADLFFQHERGKFMGIYVVFVTNGAHVAGLIGGFIAQNPHLGWRWCYWVPAMIWAGWWLIMLFCLPETLYHRDNVTGTSYQQNTSWLKLFTFNGVTIRRRLKLWDFTHVFTMLRYPSVFFPALYYSVSFGIGSVLFAVTGAAAFGSIYHFTVSQIGLAIGLSTLIGTIIGELGAGPVSDYILYLNTRKTGGKSRPEARLQAIWPGFFLCPVGVIIEGVCFQYKTHWAG